MFFLMKRNKNKLSKNYFSSKYYYPILFDFKISRDPITGLFGMDINELYAIILWVIPDSPAYKIGIFPRDLIYSIDGIIVKPGDSWYQKYLLYRNTVTITLIPTNRIFPKPKLKKKLIRVNFRMGDIITRDLQYTSTLSIKKQGKSIESFQYKPDIAFNYIDGEMHIQDRVYI